MLLLSATVNAQTTDTVISKIKKLPYLNYEIAPRFHDTDIPGYVAKALPVPQSGSHSNGQYAVAALYIDSSGVASNAQIIKSFSAEVDANILKMFSSPPKMIPAYYNGHNVNNNLVMIIRFGQVHYNDPAIKAICVPYSSSQFAEADNEQIFVAVQQPPTFPGGPQAFNDFLDKNLNYPPQDKANSLEGKVIITFVIEKDGTVDNLNILRSPDDLMSKEALRLMQACPKYNPGTQNGQAVRVQYTVVIPFWLNK